MEYKITVHEIALSYCQVVKKGSYTARLVFTQRYFSYRFLLIGDWEECPAVIVLFRGILPHGRESVFPNPGKFCLWNLESWALESGIQFKESGSHKRLESRIQVPLTKTGINYRKSGIHGPESKTVLDSLDT